MFMAYYPVTEIHPYLKEIGKDKYTCGENNVVTAFTRICIGFPGSVITDVELSSELKSRILGIAKTYHIEKFGTDKAAKHILMYGTDYIFSDQEAVDMCDEFYEIARDLNFKTIESLK